jgi:hypothetical protein
MPPTPAAGTANDPVREHKIAFLGKFLEDMTREELIKCATYGYKRIKALEERNYELSRAQFDAFR